MRIAICAPSTPFTRADAEHVRHLAAEEFPDAELMFHDQCFVEDGHFAGNDEVRLDAFLSVANDPQVDAVWFARGGYGAARIAAQAISRLGDTAWDKIYMGYSDAGNLLGALYRAGIGRPVHGPMPADIRRAGGSVAISRALDYMVSGGTDGLEPHIRPGHKYAAFNLMTLSMMTGTDIMPDLSGHVVMMEEVSEYHYAFDRAMFHVTANLRRMGVAGLMMGRVSDIPENDRPFGAEVDEIIHHWCTQHDLPYFGPADIGHDTDNHIVPFGLAT